MNILYLSCHGTLEYDEVKLLTGMGHDVFCIGDRGGNERPSIRGRDGRCGWLSGEDAALCYANGQGNLPDHVVERADAIICMHVSKWLAGQWERVRRKKCFLRLIGQHYSGLGDRLKPLTDQGLKVIPYWRTDAALNDLHPGQTTEEVRFYKDEDEFGGWTGQRRMVLTVCNEITRGDGSACHAEAYKAATDGLPRLLVGKKNRFFGDFTARVPYWMLKELYRECAVYFYVGTEPATYTLNLIEAMMTGVPIIALDTGATSELASFTSNDPHELGEALEGALENPRQDSSRRNLAIDMFGKQQAQKAWQGIL